MKNIKNKFYVGAPHLVNDSGNYRKPTLEAAIKHAQQLMDDEGDDNPRLIVKIVAVVERQAKPIKVTKV